MSSQLRTPGSELVAGYILGIVFIGLVVGVFLLTYFVGEVSALCLLVIPLGLAGTIAIYLWKRAIRVEFGEGVTVRGYWFTRQYPKLLGWCWYERTGLILYVGDPLESWSIPATRKQVAQLEE